MKIVFDAYWWRSGPTSLRHVLREIVLAWTRIHPQDELALVVRRRDVDLIDDVPEGITVVGSRWRPQALLAGRATETARRRLGYDVVVTQNFAARSRGRSAVYLHDVLFITDPGWFSRIERLYFSFMPRWVDRADIVFSSSAAEGRRIKAHTRARRVVPVGLGLSTELVGPTTTEPVEGLVPGRFLLTVGRLNSRKNLGRTVRAALEGGAATPDRPIVVVGAGDPEHLAADPAFEEALANGALRITGHVSDAQLRWLYGSTALFVFLSLGEGFGMPPVEARHFGAPVLASDLPVFRENLANEAAYTDPLDEHAIAGAMRDLLTGQDDRSSRMEARHDWAATVIAMRAALDR
jgi:glycosyltransferase involved in cell wall biosynthesis